MSTPDPWYRPAGDCRARADVLTRRECLELLATVPIGRVVFDRDGYPQAYPVNFATTTGSIWLRTDGTGALGRLPPGTRVAFQVDSIDAWRRTGWSVLVTGHSRMAADTDFPTTDPRHGPWAPGQRDHVLQVVPEQISGRRVTPPALAKPDD